MGVPLTLIGAVLHIAIDGWTYDPFAGDGDPPVYSMLIGVGVMAFALGTILTAAAAYRRQAPSLPTTALLLGGVLYFPAIPLGAIGHVLWSLPWLCLGALLVMKRTTVAKQGTDQANATQRR
ncbi:MAG: hypothetical protein H0U15_06935 [Geodermatophilaceae bacterium]|nr:hypothetical protein [Geodermatophilaceae bacterium]